MPRQRARVDPLHAGDLPGSQIIFERDFRTPAARNFAQFLDDKSAHVRFTAFLIERICAVVSDQRVSHRHDLTAIRRIGQHLLVTGHRGVETNFADPRALARQRIRLRKSDHLRERELRASRRPLRSFSSLRTKVDIVIAVLVTPALARDPLRTRDDQDHEHEHEQEKSPNRFRSPGFSKLLPRRCR